MQALAQATGGPDVAATEATEAESLRLSADALVRYTREHLHQPFRDWDDAIRPLFLQFSREPTLVVPDEIPFLSQVLPALPSIIQRELAPGGAGSASYVRLVLCGPTMSEMGRLLSGPAPLRGRGPGTVRRAVPVPGRRGKGRNPARTQGFRDRMAGLGPAREPHGTDRLM